MARSKSTEPNLGVSVNRPGVQSWLFNPHSKRNMDLEAPMHQSRFMLG